MQDVRIKARGTRVGPGKACSCVEECIVSAPSRSYFIRQRDGEGSTLIITDNQAFHPVSPYFSNSADDLVVVRHLSMFKYFSFFPSRLD